MQVLYSGLGGHGSVFFSLVEGDTEKKARHSALFFGIEEVKPEYTGFCRKNNIASYAIKKEEGAYAKSWKEAYSVFKADKPDVIVLHSLNLLLVALAYVANHKCKLIVVEHTSLKDKTRSEWLFSVIAMFTAPEIVMLTNEYRKQFRKRLGNFFFRENKVSVIGNGINFTKYAPAGKKAGGATQIIVSMIARFSATKDQKTLVRAISKLQELNYAPLPIKLMLAGSGDKLAEVQREVELLNLQQAVEFCGVLDEQSIIPFLQNTDIYVHSSLAETMSTSVLQALSVGLPVIGSDINGVRNLIVNGETGLLFPPADAMALAKCIIALLNDPVRRETLGANARNYTISHYSHHEMYRKYERLFNSPA